MQGFESFKKKKHM